MGDEPTSTATSTIMTAISTLSPPQRTALTHTILADVHRRHLRTAAVLSSPSLFSLTLRHLLSLSLHLKSLLIARLLLSSLRLLTSHLLPLPLPLPTPSLLRLRDLDAASLLLLLCDLHHRDPLALESSSPSQWRTILRKYCSENVLSLSGIGAHGGGGVLGQYVETVVRCRYFVGAIDCFPSAEEGRAAAAAAVVALPSVEAGGDGEECAICKEEVEAGRDVCELPCEHRFHWMCILPWLKKRNTCPCCRLELPTDDVLGEIQRLWNVLVKIGSGSRSGSCTWTAMID